MGDMFLDAMSPLYKRFPELLPDYLNGPYKISDSAYLPNFYAPDLPLADATVANQ